MEMSNVCMWSILLDNNNNFKTKGKSLNFLKLLRKWCFTQQQYLIISDIIPPMLTFAVWCWPTPLSATSTQSASHCGRISDKPISIHTRVGAIGSHIIEIRAVNVSVVEKGWYGWTQNPFRNKTNKYNSITVILTRWATFVKNLCEDDNDNVMSLMVDKCYTDEVFIAIESVQAYHNVIHTDIPRSLLRSSVCWESTDAIC